LSTRKRVINDRTIVIDTIRCCLCPINVDAGERHLCYVLIFYLPIKLYVKAQTNSSGFKPVDSINLTYEWYNQYLKNKISIISKQIDSYYK
jgi:hypothetical protein